MAKQTLPVDFQDDILNASMNEKRRYRITPNADGTYCIEDVSAYDQVGSNFGMAQINATNTAVNESADKNKILDSLDDIMANTQLGYMAGALAVRELNTGLPTWGIGTTDTKVINPSGQHEFNITFKKSYSVIPQIFITPRFSAPARLSYAVNAISTTSARIFVFNYGPETLTVTLDYFAIIDSMLT